MTREIRSIRIPLDAATEQKLKTAAARRGVSVERYCSDAVHNELSQEAPVQKFSAEGMIAAGEAIFQGKHSEVDSPDLIREARGKRQSDMEALANLFAECDVITQGRISATDSADLIREAREERHRDTERNGSP